ncbi:flagellar basal body P-ring protein FlgI [Pigmentibacter sp. JX0631]|uniref:flagellar basal body P-ring protein FlgI n=1 Tax=Pigmentibacter sp. JX0631 TaxID=2976982 RepID=UPI00246824F6|nr:flagellar basal body P-ring protein FlgI [Pigmentibacter sp. JX0631]WGL60797.1 flagellar basal body P-ring protein FlgI [Pigmentibacter sp. JX0631]
MLKILKLKIFISKLLFVTLLSNSAQCFAQEKEAGIRIKDLVEIRGVRGNSLTGLGLVVGLQGTGDSKASVATNKAAASVLNRLGMSVTANEVITKNTAVVAVTASLPPFARIGDKIDVRISSIGDSSSLEGGTLLLTTLTAADGQVYATAQGSITQGTSMAGNEGGAGQPAKSSAPKTVSLALNGIVEKEFPATFINNNKIELSLINADFTTASRIAKVLNDYFNDFIADPVNSGLISVKLPRTVTRNNPSFNPVTFVAILEQLKVVPDSVAQIVINERTGTIIAGNNVILEPVAISHGRLEIIVGKKSSKVADLPLTTTVGELVRALNTLGAGPKDVVSILQTLESSKALRAKIKIL